MPEGITIAFTNLASNRRRYRFERLDAGGWTRLEEEYDGETWRPVGEEIVADFDIEADAAVVGELDVVDEPAGTVVTGP